MEFELKKKGRKKVYIHDLIVCATVVNNGEFLCTMDERLEELKDLD